MRVSKPLRTSGWPSCVALGGGCTASASAGNAFAEVDPAHHTTIRIELAALPGRPR